MVFQSYALYPHMTVRENLEFSLKLAKLPRAEIDARVESAVAHAGARAYLDRRPADLSGGQRQRVAMGRAIVREPKVFLFDEPLSNLDAKLRSQMRVEIKRLQRRLQVTTIYVTHDQIEAMTLADIIVVMRAGVIEQAGTPLEVFERPANMFVAGFIGSPPMNFFRRRAVRRSGDGLRLRSGELALPVPQRDFAARPAQSSLGFRPEDIVPEGHGLDAGEGRRDSARGSSSPRCSATRRCCSRGSAAAEFVAACSSRAPWRRTRTCTFRFNRRPDAPVRRRDRRSRCRDDRDNINKGGR